MSQISNPSSRKLRAMLYWAGGVLILVGLISSCHRLQGGKHGHGGTPTLTHEDSVLAAQYPVLEHLVEQRGFLLAHSKPAKEVAVSRGEDFQGKFSEGVIDLVMDEIDGEPMHFYGHMEKGRPDLQMDFIIYNVPNATLDSLTVGQTCRVHWIETVVYPEPFDDDKYRHFLAFRIEGK